MAKQLKKGTIKDVQRYISNKIIERGFDDEPLHERLLLLTEEVGELAKACRKINGMNVTKEGKYGEVGEEIADVINMTFAVAIQLNLDVEGEFLKKEKKIDTRVYKREKIKP